MRKTNYVSNKNIQLSSLFGNSIRSKIVTILLEGKEISQKDLNKRVNLFGDECGLSIIQEHITELKKESFVVYRRDGTQFYWRIKDSNPFLRNLAKLMKAPKANYSGNDIVAPRKRKTTEMWCQEVLTAINTIISAKDKSFSSKEIKTLVNIGSQRLNQILKVLMEQKSIGRVEGKRGLYYLMLKLSK